MFRQTGLKDTNRGSVIKIHNSHIKIRSSHGLRFNRGQIPFVQVLQGLDQTMLVANVDSPHFTTVRLTSARVSSNNNIGNQGLSNKEFTRFVSQMYPNPNPNPKPLLLMIWKVTICMSTV